MVREFATEVQTPWGPVTAYGDGQGITEVTFEEKRGDLPELPYEFGRMMDEYAAGTRRDFPLPLVMEGTPEVLRVAYAVLAIPYGAVQTAETIARALGITQDAVMQAVQQLPLMPLVPTHRLRADHPLTRFEQEAE